MSEELAVWLRGRRAGTLVRSRGRLTFVYDERYRLDRESTPLSISMRKRETEHGHDAAGQWFDNLLPDDDEVRRRWKRELGTPSDSVFDLLASMGVDCAGAVQVVPGSTAPDQTGTLQRLTDDDVAHRLSRLRMDHTAWNPDASGGQWSLAGAQGKFALARAKDGSWVVPTGRMASTHIFKVGVTGFANADSVEFVTMRAAKHLGIDVAEVDIMAFGDQTALVVTRYDRVHDSFPTTRRHQEDLCQALGRRRQLKYQSDGGPSIADISALLRGLDGVNAGRSQELFGKALVYNWLTVGIDAHAKNYSLLLERNRATLAPLYDLTSAALLMDRKQLWHKGKLAMRMGREYTVGNIRLPQLVACADELGVDPAWLIDIAKDYRARIPDAFERATLEAVEASGGLIEPTLKDTFVPAITAHVARTAKTAQLAK